MSANYRYVKEEDKKLAVFDKSGPYLPTKKIGKNNPKEGAIKEDNEVRKRWNYTVDEALLTGIVETEIVVIKQVQISENVKDSIKTYGEFPYFFKSIVEAAIQFLKEVISKFLLPPKPVFHGNMARYEQMETQRQGFMRVVQQMKTVDEQEIQPLKAKYEALNSVFKVKERKELEKKLNVAVMYRNSFELQLSSLIEGVGYRNIREFMEDYNKFSGAVSRYEAEVSEWEKECREIEIGKRYEEGKKPERIWNIQYQVRK